MIANIKALLKLMRWFHELAVLLPFVSLYIVIKYFAVKNNIHCSLPITDFMALCFCVQLLLAAGCVLNDIVDRNIDKVNKPQTHIVDNRISLKNAISIFIVLSALSLLCSIYISYFIFWQWGYISICVYVISLLYDFYFKRMPLIGNLVMGILTAFIPLVLFFYAHNCISAINNERLTLLIYLYAFFPLLIIIPRELSLDISDMEGDKVDGCKTLPLVIGEKKSKQLVVIFLLIPIVLSLYLMLKFSYLRVALIMIDVLIIIYINKLRTTHLRIDYIRIGRFLWFIMLFGLLCFTVLTLF